MIKFKALLVSLLLTNASTAAGNDPEFLLSDILPTGYLEIEFMDVALSERGVELEKKLQRATLKNNGWLLDYIEQNAKPGEPLPYHANFGLSKAEYEEFQEARTNRKIKPTGVRWICLFSVEDGEFSIVPVKHRSTSVGTIAINLQNNHAKASGLDFGKGLWGKREGLDSAIGPWRGYNWRIEYGNITDGKEFLLSEIHVLHRLDSNKMLIRHQLQATRNRKKERSFELMFQFDAPSLESE